MPSIFISYSHDSANPAHGERVAGLAASLLRDGFTVFFDQNRGNEEEKVPWATWMDDKIEMSDFVLLVCTELYLKKVRQKIDSAEGMGGCWEANLIYNELYAAKLNTTKFVPVFFSKADRAFVPKPLQNTSYSFVLSSHEGYSQLCAFLVNQHRSRFPDQGNALPEFQTKTIAPLFNPAGKHADAAKPRGVTGEPLIDADRFTLRLDQPPAARCGIRGLDWYEECDAGHFLGREEDSNRVVSMLLSRPIVRLIGPSGVGKSSLIRAGLLPRIRECGWRACVIRPFENPAQRLPEQLSAQLLANGGQFVSPLDPAKLRSELTGLLRKAGITRLVLLLDQFEDIVSPLAAANALETMREFLGNIWEGGKLQPYLRAVLVYRSDAEARLGRLWQEISGRSEGLPYHVLQALSRETAEKVLEQTAQKQGWNFEVAVPEIVRQLASESRAIDCGGDVFPVYLQIFLEQAAAAPDGRISCQLLENLGGVSGLIGSYFQKSLVRLQARGGDWQHCGAILESLSRSTGTKTTQSIGDLARETGLGHAALAEMLPILVNERLIRPVGDETFEIQHDRLAAAVIESMKDIDREAKVARDFLAAKVPAFQHSKTPLAPGDLFYLYRHRHRIHPSEQELRIILATIVQQLPNFSNGYERNFVGWYWFRQSSEDEWRDRLVQVARWASKPDNSLRSGEWLLQLLATASTKSVVVLATDPLASLRRIAVEVAALHKPEGFVELVCSLSKDEDPQVRCEVAKALVGLMPAEALPILRDLLKDKDSEVRCSAAQALADLMPVEALCLLCASWQRTRIGTCAVKR